MNVRSRTTTWRPFILRIALPSIFTITLCLLAIFAFILPAFEANMMAGKRLMIKELTNSAWSIINKFHHQEKQTLLSPGNAKNQALNAISSLRYGDEEKDYFWVTDLGPRMLMHPFREDLNGKDLSDYTDPAGKPLFVESVQIARASGDGYLGYIWEDKNNPEMMVPKLSYVKYFEPWGWVIGTGIYLEDVEEEIQVLTGQLLGGSLFVTVLIALLLAYVTRESLKIETERRRQKERLQESREKYRQLVEASTEGLVMILDNDIVYANKLFQDLTGYSDPDLRVTKIADLLSDPAGKYSSGELVQRLLSSTEYQQVVVRIARKDDGVLDGLISISPIVIGNRAGHVITVSDNEQQKQIEGELDRSREQYQHLIENINVGVFRTTVGKQSHFVEANPACVSIFGLTSREELFSRPSWEMFLDSSERNSFLKKFSRDGSIKHYPLRLHHKDGKLATVSISAVLVRDNDGKPIYCDGLIEDISETFEHEREQKRLIGDLQRALLFLNEPIRQSVSQRLVSCNLSTPVNAAARLMEDADTGALLVRGEEASDYVGMVTDHDIRKRLVAAHLKADTAVSQIMSAPLISVHEDALMFEGLLAMLENNVGHIVIKDNNGKATRVVGAMQFLRNQKYPLAMLLRDINGSETPEQLFRVRERLPSIIQATYASNPDSLNMTRIISAAAEAVTKKCLLFAIDELGPPPSSFVFMALGSVGREEQTLVTDQDNALVYDDVSPGKRAEAEHYFLKLGEKVCTWLDRAGYSFCDGEIMAMNSKWCQPLTIWQDYFTQWVSTSEPADLLESKIFFDFRGVYGDLDLVNRLRNHLHEQVKQKPMFLFHLVHNCLQFKPPLGMFKNIVVESAGEHRETFSVKKAMTPIVDLVRIYALKHEISETSTFSRLLKLEADGHLSPTEYRELTLVYRSLLEQRFKHQLVALDQGTVPDNHVNPKELTEMEQAILREAMSQTSSFQSKMSFDFTGSA